MLNFQKFLRTIPPNLVQTGNRNKSVYVAVAAAAENEHNASTVT